MIMENREAHNAAEVKAWVDSMLVGPLLEPDNDDVICTCGISLATFDDDNKKVIKLQKFRCPIHSLDKEQGQRHLI
jgi:hypothetical protein